MAERLDPRAVAIANESLWQNHPELKRRQLTLGPEDKACRLEWWKNYHEAANSNPTPPPPIVEPQRCSEPPPATVVREPSVPCPAVAGMTHEEKMEEAIKRANLGPEVMEELGDIKTLVASMVIVGGVLIAIAATGYGAVAEAIAAALLLIGAALSGAQIGEGINSLIDFFEKTRCDRAKTPEDLDTAGKSFGDGIAKMGVGGLNLLLSLLGGRKGPRKPGSSPKTKVFNPADRPKGVPSHWVAKPSKAGGGTKFVDPNNPHNSVRVMPGNPKSPYPNSQKPYVRHVKDGQSLDINGKPVPKNSPEAHIPLEEFKWPFD